MVRLTTFIYLVAVLCIADTQPPEYWKEKADRDLQRALRLKQNTNVAKNIVLFLGDGNGISTITATRIYKGQMQPDNLGGEEYELYYERFPNIGMSKTYCNDRQVPDSAATGTAYLCGVKSNYNTIGMDYRVQKGNCTMPAPAVDSILKLAQDAGKATGIVTTTRITHATPANTYAHSPERAWEGTIPDSEAEKGCKDIAYQLVKESPGNKIKVILGGGRETLLTNTTQDYEYPDKKGKRTDGLDLVDEWLDSHAGDRATFVWNTTGFDNVDPAETDYLLGVFEPGHMQYEANRTNEPSLEEMVEKAIRILKKDKDGFFLLVEAGRMDHSHHDGKAFHALVDGVAFEAAVKKGGDLLSEDDTLTIVTADHSFAFDILGYPGRGNPILGINDLERDLDGLPFTTLNYLDGPGAPEVLDSIKQSGYRPNLTNVDTGSESYLQQTLIRNKWAGHDGEDVNIYAKGPMSHLFHSTHEQTYIFHAMKYAACIGDVPDDCSYRDPPPITCSASVNIAILWMILSVALATFSLRE
ncbi:alkaline phosphatase, tissue-nonspecific isozyme-like [Ptychodera flava]|uniref:alkaline phosphatase, tissue-nonspecific isozyme-like n=1 Tax=Ptychodera flava TaxID=63121 RepID=UPI00396A3C41